jgi:hypothetical protein
MKQFLLGIFLLSSITGFTQTLTPDQFIADSIAIMKVKLVRPQFKFDNRQTYCEKQWLSVNGFDVGVLLNEKLRFTLGYYTMAARLKAYSFTAEDQEYGRVIEMQYGSLNTELIYKDTRFISFGMPLEIGAGVNTLRNKNFTTGEIILNKTGGLIFVNFGMSGTFKPMRFLGLKGIVGYRKVAYNQVKDFNFDGFFTSIGLNIDIHAITTDVQMYRLKKRYHRGNNLANAVDIITD